METLVFYDIKDNYSSDALAVLSKYIDNIVAIGLNRCLKDDNENYLNILEDILYDNDDISNVYFLDLAPRNKEDYLNILEDILYDNDDISNVYFLDLTPRNKEDYNKVVRLCLSYDVPLTIRPAQTWLNVAKIKQGSKNKQKEEVKKLADVGKLLNWNIVYINEEIDNSLISEVGNELCLQYKNIVDFFINVKYDEKEDNYLYSLRSLNGEALKFIRSNNFKGGGYNNACGFTHDINILDNIIPFDNK